MRFNAGANNGAATKPILENSVQIYKFNSHPFDTVPNIVGGNADAED
jgi:hypothetical protein